MDVGEAVRPIIVHHANTLGYGGSQKMVQLHLKYMQQLDQSFCHVIAYQAHGDRAREDYFAEIIGRDRLVLYASIPEFVEILRELQPAILHHSAAGISEFPLVAGIREILPNTKLVSTSVFGNQNDQIEPDKIIYVANHIQHLAGTFGNKYTVIRNPIEPPCTTEDLREELGIPQEAFVFGRIGRDDESIYDPINLQAYAQIQTNNTFFVLVNPSLRSLSDSRDLHLQNIVVVDKTTDETRLSRFYNTIDVLAHSRRDGECCPANIFEAMAHGKPIITHYGNPFNGQVDSVGNAGFCVAPGDVDEYARVMYSFIMGYVHYEALSDNALVQWRREVEPSQQAEKLLTVYKELIS